MWVHRRRWRPASRCLGWRSIAPSAALLALAVFTASGLPMAAGFVVASCAQPEDRGGTEPWARGIESDYKRGTLAEQCRGAQPGPLEEAVRGQRALRPLVARETFDRTDTLRRMAVALDALQQIARFMESAGALSWPE